MDIKLTPASKGEFTSPASLLANWLALLCVVTCIGALLYRGDYLHNHKCSFHNCNFPQNLDRSLQQVASSQALVKLLQEK